MQTDMLHQATLRTFTWSPSADYFFLSAGIVITGFRAFCCFVGILHGHKAKHMHYAGKLFAPHAINVATDAIVSHPKQMYIALSV